MDEDNCWVLEEEAEALNEIGTTYVSDPQTGTRYTDGDRIELQLGFQGARHMEVALEVVGDLALTEDAEGPARTRYSLYDASGERIAGSLCALRYPYDRSADRFVFPTSVRVVVSGIYWDQVIGHTATLTAEVLDVFGNVATGQVQLDIYAEDYE